MSILVDMIKRKAIKSQQCPKVSGHKTHNLDWKGLQ